MRYLKLILAASLSLTALISTQAIPITWTLSNFEYANKTGNTLSGSDTRWTPPEIRFNLSKGGNGMLGNAPDGDKIIINSILFSVTGVGIENVPCLQLKQGDKVIATASTLINRTLGGNRKIYYSSNQSYDRQTWRFSFDNQVYLDTSIDYTLVFTTSNGNVFDSTEEWDGRALSATTAVNEMFEGNLVAPFIELHGVYDAPPGGVPEPTALAVVAVGAAFALLRRRVG